MAMANLFKYVRAGRPELIDTLSSRYYANWSHMRKTYEQGHAVTSVFKRVIAEAKTNRPSHIFANADIKKADQLSAEANKLKVRNLLGSSTK